ncbi:PDR/VanB family oxidoreductase [Crenobacter cavernae]|uniref:Carnitine monooxygenase reductase subunit n=1 Tax=Crenobacter cavernae TaxID=2290923 RepID=A0ABY0F9A3_9NEIS|nr:PDR/VanB family oxidoreductase [Crenobacter cavernae]RXZ42048.1 oxidoreductase [Crenobacter cavernae]
MANKYEMMTVRVTAIDEVTPLIKRFTLEATNGENLPAFTGGSHVIVQMQDGAKRHSNAYSLMSSPRDLSCYQIGVRREEQSKGGSAFMHDKVAVGDTLTISTPNNLFALSDTGSKHVLIAGGIGITPFVSQMAELAERGADYELHYSFRSFEHGAFAGELAAGAHGERCRFYVNSEGTPLNVDALVDKTTKDGHVYVCGPRPLIDAVISACRRRGLAEEQIHWEQFAAAPQTGGAFTVVLAKSGRELQVEEGGSILKAIESTVSVECLCREGVCGTCETKILEGEAEHFDQYLSDAEKAAQQTMMICVSRAKGARIVLDL